MSRNVEQQAEPEASAEERFTTEVLRQARVRPNLCAEDIAIKIFGWELEQIHVDLVTSVFLDAGLDPNGVLDDDEGLSIELIEQTDVLANHGRVRGAGWRPLEPVETDDSISTEFGEPAVFSAYGETSPKRYVETPRKHGTAYTYEKLGCRCETCREWKRARNAKQYAERKARR
jgi:hypothetical protein